MNPGYARPMPVGAFDSHIHCSGLPDDLLRPYAKLNGLSYGLEELIGLMRRHRVQGGLLLSPPLRDGSPAPNETILELCSRSGGRLFPVLTAEPDAGSISRCIALAGDNRIAGFKVRLGYRPVYPTDPVFDPLYDFAEERRLPVLFHTGDTAVPDGSLEHARPLNLDVLANRRKKLKMVVCHFGNPWFMDTAELVYKHPNVYADTSGLFVRGGRYDEEYARYLARRLSEAVYHIGNADKIMFGTDYPVTTYSDALRIVRMMKISQEDKEKIFYSNAKGLFFP